MFNRGAIFKWNQKTGSFKIEVHPKLKKSIHKYSALIYMHAMLMRISDPKFVEEQVRWFMAESLRQNEEAAKGEEDEATG